MGSYEKGFLKLKFKPNRFLNLRFLYVGFHCIRNKISSKN